jgi:dolichyl-phosphate beta-glucosyltransferase
MVNHPILPEVSIVIPIYNGSHLLDKHLTPFITWLRNRPYRTQVILVDDGSDDREKISAYAHERDILFLGLTSNKGKGAALREGFASAVANIQIFTDADIPFHYDNLDSFVSLIRNDPGKLFIGNRADPSSIYFEKTSLVRNFGSRLVSRLVQLFFVRTVRDTQCGLKGMGKDVARLLFGGSRIDRFAIDIELIYLAAKNNVPICKVPVQLRFNDASTVFAARDGLKLLSDMYRIRKNHGKHT